MKTYATDVEAVDALHSSYKEIRDEIAQVIVGQDEVVKSVLISIFSNGHCLLVGVPGLAKTLLVQTVAQVLDLSYNRIQFTPDLMPSDIIGSEILGEDRSFKFIKGPVFSNIILADEINRTPPKTQAALLEAMQEKVVTVGGKTHKLPQPFFVLATQNPIEQEGTYPLPEAQLDRFMFNVSLTYPTFEQELQVVKNTTANRDVSLKKVLNSSEISYFQQLVRNIPITDHVLEYAVSLAAKTRPGTSSATDDVNKFLSWGAGPRASQFLVLGAKCHAAITGKYSPDKEDVKAVAESILRHRIVRNYKAEAEGISTEKLISNLL
ncbi:AAA family ATPase [Daejeonella lutea]|uniref:MoxR-like ATPase n=1 Tax=Daejeonella lutea TaxID=572036 RepID=A0A1T5CUU8_9SPHI|nr:MoxR family ATPase [Daejeonella lutea]SKB63308.1 MoxR-like ATPase [Daejeonella lutea]